jgi:hypothetical protein
MIVIVEDGTGAYILNQIPQLLLAADTPICLKAQPYSGAEFPGLRHELQIAS